MKYKTDQENFWAQDFGKEYIVRNKSAKLIAANTNLFAKIFEYTGLLNSVLELGANIGNNLIAIKRLLPETKIAGVEINQEAFNELEKIPDLQAHKGSILEFKSQDKYDLVFTKGVLIHINPEELKNVYAKMYSLTNKYILVAEYYNPTPVSINYRGHDDRLFKRDFAGEILDLYPDLELTAYGFGYHRDKNFPLDDISWFLLKKPK